MSELSPTAALQLGSINQAHLYHVWFGLGGDARLVQRATGVRAEVVEALAHDFGWHQIAGGKLGLTDKKAEREINRAVSYAQGKRLTSILEKAMQLIEDEPERLKQALFTTTEDGRAALTAKPLVELAKAVETAHTIQYRALGDKVMEDADPVTAGTERMKSLSLTVNNWVNNAAAQTKTAEVVLPSLHV